MEKHASCARTEGMATLLENLGPRAYHLAFRLCRNPDEARDLVQEACYRTLRCWERLDHCRNPEAWLLTVLRHALIDRRRRKEGRCRSLDAFAEILGDAPHQMQVGDGEKPILDILIREEAISTVRSAIRELPPRHQQVLVLCDIQRLGYDAVAEELGVPLGTLRSRLSRARQQLRLAITERDPELAA